MCSSNPELNVACGEIATNINMRKRKQPDCAFTEAFASFQLDIKNTLAELKQDLNSRFDRVDNDVANLKKELESNIADVKKEFNALRCEYSVVKQQVADLSRDVSDVQESLQFHTNAHDQLKKQVENISVKTEATGSSHPMLRSLESKIDTMEQQARQCNLEVSNLPEKRGENLMSILESIGSLVGCTIGKTDIIAVHRVPHAQAQDKRPKNIVVKFTNCVLRDNIISAYRLKKGLTSNQLGISGAPVRIYLNEHLTLRNKQLFREAREAAKKHNYKYVWVKHSTIFVRKSDTSPVQAIRTFDDIKKIKSDA